jgi:3-oxoacyl-[acyl-carrier-protein] synthase-3
MTTAVADDTIPRGHVLAPPDRAQWSSLASVGILGTGSYLPARVVSNDEVGLRAGVDDEWIRRKTGISTRRWAASSEATSDLAAEAATAALADAGIDATELSLLVVATSTPDHSQPPTAAITQAKIGARHAAAYDVNAVCSGFEFALNMVAQALAVSGGYAVVVGADLYSRILNPADRRSVILFGDGAGAVVLGPSADARRTVVAGKIVTFGEYADAISVPMGGTRIPYGTHPDDDLRFFRMDGRAVRSFVVGRIPALIRAFLDECGVAPEAVRHFIPHQANGVMLEELYQALDLPSMQLHLVVSGYGNTGAASIPITLAEVAARHQIAEGELALFAGFGGGMSAGLTLVRW